MFKEKFKAEVDNIKLPEKTKALVLDSMERAVLRQPIKIKVRRLKLTAAVAAMVAICLVAVSVFEIYNKHPQNMNVIKTPSGIIINDEPEANINGLKKPANYDEVYELFDNSVKEEYEYYEDVVDEGFDEESDGIPQSNSANFSNGIGSKGDAEVGTNSTTQQKPTTNTVTTPETEFSETNTQVEGVDESDIVKTDGNYIYILKTATNKVVIAKPNNGKIIKTATITLTKQHLNGHYINYDEMYVNSNMLIAVGNTYSANGIPRAVADFYSLENPEAPKHINTLSQTGNVVSSRISNGVLYMFSTQNYSAFTVDKQNPKTYLPFISTKDKEEPILSSNIYLFGTEKDSSQTYLVSCSMKIKTAEFITAKAVMGGGEEIFTNEKSVYVVREFLNQNNDDNSAIYKTKIVRFEIGKNGTLSPVAVGEVKGTVLNQFSMAESDDGYFRIVTTAQKRTGLKYNNLYILNSRLKLTGRIENLAPDEKIYSARLSGDIGYFVTYREVDPLFAVDLRNPNNPKILSKLKIPGFSEYLHPYGDGLLLGIGKDSNDRGLIKLSMFNVKDPRDVTQKHTKILKETYAAVNENHKAGLISVSKNLIGFAVGYDAKYYLFSYSSKGFVQKAVLKSPSYFADYNRGLFIGNYLYLCSYEGIKSYNLTTLKPVDSVSFGI